MQSTYITWLKVCKYHNIPQSDWHLNGQYHYIEFFNGSRIDLLDLVFKPSDPLYERFGSLEYTDGAIEETGEVHFMAYDVLKTRIGRHLNKEYGIPATLLLSGNPKKNWTYQIFYKPWNEKRLPDNLAFIQALYGDNPHTAEEYGKQLSKITDKSTKERLMFGNWEYDEDPNKLILYDNILDLFTNTAEPSEEKYLTGDVARLGGNKITIFCWQGFKVYRAVIKERQRINITSDDIKEILREERIPYSHAIVDEDGLGGGVVDNTGINGFVNNSSSLPNPKTEEKYNYKNLKTQCAYMFAEAVNKHAIAISCELSELDKQNMIEDLDQIRAESVEKEAPLQLVPKEKVIELLGRSPDYSDGLIQRMWFELQTPNVPVGEGFKGYQWGK